MHTFADKNQVITTLIHLGYFAYDKAEQEAYVPNKKIQEVFYKYLENETGDNLSRYMKLSEEIAEAVLTMEESRTAALIQQVRSYPASLQEYAGEILLVGVTYDKKTKEHQCRIESFQKEDR